MTDASSWVISNILKHDDKTTSYKIALLRSINDVVFAHPDLSDQGRAVAVTLVVLAEFMVSLLLGIHRSRAANLSRQAKYSEKWASK